MTEYRPHNWVCLKLPKDGEYKILAGWSGGYLDSDYWRLNSGIIRIEENDTQYIVHGYSGSVYYLDKDHEYTRMNIHGIFNQLKDRGCEEVKLETIKDAIKGHEDGVAKEESDE